MGERYLCKHQWKSQYKLFDDQNNITLVQIKSFPEFHSGNKLGVVQAYGEVDLDISNSFYFISSAIIHLIIMSKDNL